jgi:hypothetical protein
MEIETAEFNLIVGSHPKTAGSFPYAWEPILDLRLVHIHVMVMRKKQLAREANRLYKIYDQVIE